MNESDKPTTQNEIQENQFRRAVLARALDLVDSRQNVQGWMGATFLTLSTESAPYITQLKARLATHTSSQRNQFDKTHGVSVNGIFLEAKMNQILATKEKARFLDTAWEKGFARGVVEALAWVGLTETKWSSSSPEICALEALAAVSGIPTARQLNHMRPETLLGCKVAPNEPKYINRRPNLNFFQRGEVREIMQVHDSDLFECLCEPGEVALERLVKEAKKGYREGVELAFLQFVIVGESRVHIDPLERISNAYANARRGSGVR